MAYALAESWYLPAYGITFNSGLPDDTGCVYWVTEDMGWRGGAAPRPFRNDKATSQGQYRRPNYKTGLVTSWNGHLFGDTPSQRAAGERKLASIGADPGTLVEVRCTDSVGTLFSMMELNQVIQIEPMTLTDAAFTMQWGAPDPRRYVAGSTIGGSTTQASSTGGLDWATGGGLSWPLNWGTVISTGQILFVNTGTAPTDPTFTITVPSGTLTGAQITLVSTGQRLHYNGTLNAGDTLTISTSAFNRSVLLNGSQDVRVLLDIAEWFQLPVGASSVTLTATNTNAAATLTGSAYIAYW